ncbi:hypothetical protein [Streptomyces cellulosae]|uniref:Uncharacterized protein n=1 Tax=Streptomyces cellulosae TaxID=1968 RepID=A0ABW7XXJ5_STRCE
MELIEGTARFGHEVPRHRHDLRGGNYIDCAFEGVATSGNGRNGIRLVVDDSGNPVAAMPKNYQRPGILVGERHRDVPAVRRFPGQADENPDLFERPGTASTVRENL